MNYALFIAFSTERVLLIAEGRNHDLQLFPNCPVFVLNKYYIISL